MLMEEFSTEKPWAKIFLGQLEGVQGAALESSPPGRSTSFLYHQL